jgi:hypothetical protein
MRVPTTLHFTRPTEPTIPSATARVIVVLRLSLLFLLLGLASTWLFAMSPQRAPASVSTVLELAGVITALIGGVVLMRTIRRGQGGVLIRLLCLLLLAFGVAEGFILVRQLTFRYSGGNPPLEDYEALLRLSLLFRANGTVLLCGLIAYALAVHSTAPDRVRDLATRSGSGSGGSWWTLRNVSSGVPVLAGGIVWAFSLIMALGPLIEGDSFADDYLIGTVWLAPGLALGIIIRLAFAAVRPEPAVPRWLGIVGMVLILLMASALGLWFLFVLGVAGAMGH